MKYLLLLAIILQLIIIDPDLSFADDPCEGMDDLIIMLVAAMPQLTPDDFQTGRFRVDTGEVDTAVSYTVRDKEIFEQHVQGGQNPFQVINLGGLSALYFGDTDGTPYYCGYIVAPSYRTGKFLLIPSRRVLGAWKPWEKSLPPARVAYYQQKDSKISQVLYRPLLNGQPIEFLQNVSVKDIDSDGEMEIVTNEQPDWAESCGFSNAGTPYWKSIYHLSPRDHSLKDVSERYPKVYASIAEQLKQSLQENKSPLCNSEVDKLLRKAQQLAR